MCLLHLASLTRSQERGYYFTRLRMLYLDAGKGRQVMKRIQLRTYTALQWTMELFNASYTTLQWLESARGMCSREL